MKKVKKQLSKLVENPLYGIAAVFVLLAVIGGGVALIFTRSDHKGTTANTITEAERKARKDPGVAAAKKRKIKPAPVVNTAGTLDVARSVGRLAIAQARGRIKHPSGISVRVSAAPKQTVTVDWELSCYKAVGRQSSTRVAHDRYRTRPPNTRSLPLPLSGADECIATVGAQLTKNGSAGRIKVAVVAG